MNIPDGLQILSTAMLALDERLQAAEKKIAKLEANNEKLKAFIGNNVID